MIKPAEHIAWLSLPMLGLRCVARRLPERLWFIGREPARRAAASSFRYAGRR
ncbi:hypothetical protein [Streptomyces sp. NPDC006668]|uniref:hypothetical protein n=1 Tax=Streptomyces sp. NPDC006668 TaxID=3156903 RepID=UPI0033F37CB9